jgi:YHS domain-containing protein
MIMKKTTFLTLLALFTSTASFVVAEEKLPNAKCPLMTEDDAESGHKIIYQGKDIYLCCNICEKQWAKDPDYYAALAKELKLAPQLDGVQIPTTVKLMDQRFCPFTTKRLVGPSSPSVEYKGVKVYLSKPGHVKTWNENPDQCAQQGVAKGLLPQLQGKI